MYEQKLLRLTENNESKIKIQEEEEIKTEELRKMYEQIVFPSFKGYTSGSNIQLAYANY